jgi:hypothetical protein
MYCGCIVHAQLSTTLPPVPISHTIPQPSPTYDHLTHYTSPVPYIQPSNHHLTVAFLMA